VKYVAWTYIDRQYKTNLINNMTKTQYHNFLQSFFKDKELTEYILFKKMFKLFDCYDLGNYERDQLKKLNDMLKHVNIYDMTMLFNKINYQKINIFNVKNLLLFLRDENDFIGKKIIIGWGPGNYKNIDENIMNHYEKHVLDDEECSYWGNVDCDSYKQYAIDNFYKMKNVIVHSNGRYVYLSGFYGDVFIVGRYDEGVFGISSCYYVAGGVKNGRYKDYCFDIEFFIDD
jgi:hypothetical protein